MTTVNGDPFAALNTGTTGAATTAKKADTLGQADFMRLMTEQLANQDPLKPLSNSEFVAQLAQFSTVQGINGMQDALGAVANVMESDQTLRAASPCQPSTMAPQSIETRSPSRNTRSPGIPCTTSSFTETQITPGKPPSPCSSP